MKLVSYGRMQQYTEQSHVFELQHGLKHALLQVNRSRFRDPVIFLSFKLCLRDARL